MSESYCLKSCADCGREGCAGCRADRFSAQCEIAACCREQHHDSCESCTRAAYCPTRANRDLMPQRVLSKERHAAEHAAEYRAKAELLAKWTKFIFWSLVITNALALLGLLPSLHPLETVGSCIAVLLTSYGMFRMRGIDRRFGQVAIWQALAGLFTTLLPEVSAGENGFVVFLTLIAGAAGVYLTKLKLETLRDSLSGISGALAEKWEKQWELYKLSVCIALGGAAASIVLGILGLLVTLGGLCMLIFVGIREYVYLWQTASACEAFVARQSE